MGNTDSPWWGAKVIFSHKGLSERFGENVYEERIILVRAKTANEAIRHAERDARQYVNDLPGCKYEGYVSVFHTWEEKMDSGSEVYSLMRTSKLNPARYLDHFYDTGTERQTGHKRKSRRPRKK